MTRTFRVAVVAAAVLLLAPKVFAQDTVSLSPPDPARWDVAAHITWLGSNQSRITAPWDRWYGVGAGGVSVGRYWTPHLKFEVQGTIAGTGRLYAPDPQVPSEPREHLFQVSTLHAGVAYQFFDNQWFHPFLGAGLEVARQRHRMDIPQHFLPTRDPLPQLVPASRGSEAVSYAARPFIGSGFKWFVSERAFVRTDVATSISRRGFAHTAWSGGVGVEF